MESEERRAEILEILGDFYIGVPMTVQFEDSLNSICWKNIPYMWIL